MPSAADAAVKTGDLYHEGCELISSSRLELLELQENLRLEHKEHISYAKEHLLQLREAIEMSVEILKLAQEIEADFYGENQNVAENDVNTDYTHFQGCGRISYLRDELLRHREAADIAEGILKIKEEFEAEIKAAEELMASRFDRARSIECKAYLVGSCEYGGSCRFSHHSHYPGKNHPGQVKLNSSGLPLQPVPTSDPRSPTDHWQVHVTDNSERPCHYFMRFGTCKFGFTCKYKHSQSPDSDCPLVYGPIQQQEHMDYTEKRDQRNCLYFMKFGTCKFGSTCKFQHPPSASNEFASQLADPIQRQVQMEGSTEKHDQSDGLCFMKFGTCQSGSTCKYQHSLMSASNGPTTWRGLACPQAQSEDYPSRPGEPVCSYFVKHGSCKFRSACRFDHPSPSTLSCLKTKAGEPVHHHGQMGEYPQKHETCKFHHPVTSTSNGLTGKADVVLHQGQMEESPENPALGGLPTEPDVNVCQQGQMEHSERPREPECLTYVQLGTNIGAACKHHPNDLLPRVPSCTISPNDLSGQPTCSDSNQPEICKLGPRSEFNHPMDCGSSVPETDSKSECSGEPPLLQADRISTKE